MHRFRWCGASYVADSSSACLGLRGTLDTLGAKQWEHLSRRCGHPYGRFPSAPPDRISRTASAIRALAAPRLRLLYAERVRFPDPVWNRSWALSSRPPLPCLVALWADYHTASRSQQSTRNFTAIAFGFAGRAGLRGGYSGGIYNRSRMV